MMPWNLIICICLHNSSISSQNNFAYARFSYVTARNVSRLWHDRSKETGIWGIKLLPARLNRQTEADDWLPGECLVLPILFTQWLFLFGTAANFPTGFVWQQVTGKKCCLELLCIFRYCFCLLCFCLASPHFAPPSSRSSRPPLFHVCCLDIAAWADTQLNPNPNTPPPRKKVIQCHRRQFVSYN